MIPRTPKSTWRSCAGTSRAPRACCAASIPNAGPPRCSGSLKCDCREQFEVALERIAAEGTGVLVYLRQEGRGIGLGNKVRAYALQAEGADTVEANLALGFEADERRYDLAAAILADIGVRSIRLLTNNPLKVAGLRAAGVVVTERIAHWVGENQHNAAYLAVKRRKMGHHPDQPVRLRALSSARKLLEAELK